MTIFRSVCRRLTASLLTKKGLDVETVENGLLSVDRISSGDCIDVVVMVSGAGWSRAHTAVQDMEMPVMNGHEATRQIRALPLEKQPIIIGLTGNALVGTRSLIPGTDSGRRKIRRSLPGPVQTRC